MKIAFIAKFSTRSKDEENYAKTFEELGHEVFRIDERHVVDQMVGYIETIQPDFILWFKLSVAQPKELRERLRKYKTVCWVFDLYWGYSREYRLTTHPAFTADIVVSTDGGEHPWSSIGINHHCIRQGIYKDDCFLAEGNPEDTIILVGSENAGNRDRTLAISSLQLHYGERFKWYGRHDTNEVRGNDLNSLYATNKIIVGDSVFSPYYWSNRVVETLGRGGFLIHQEVSGLKEEYPYLVTYPRGNFDELKRLIDYYSTHEKERKEIVEKNFKWVKDHYLMEEQCKKLLTLVQ